MPRTFFLTLFFLGLLPVSGWASGEGHRLFTGVHFLTGDPKTPEARAVLVDSGGRILELYAAEPSAEAGVNVVRLQGAVALPGLHDAHFHLQGLGMKLTGLDLTGIRSREQLRERAKAYVDAHAEATVYRGFGWDQTLFADRQFPTLQDIQGLTSKPMFLMRVDGHAALVNESALVLSGAQDAPLGEPSIRRDGAGQPTGLILDAAVLRTEAALPQPTAAEKRMMLLTALRAASDAGFTAVHEMAMFGPVMDELIALQESEPLPVRVFVYMAGTEVPWLLADAITHPLRGRRFGRIGIQGVKLMIDGAMGSRGAWLYAPYSDDISNAGHVAYSLGLQKNVYIFAQHAGYQVAVHAIGDRANHEAIDWVGRYASRTNLPTRVEHAQFLTDEDFGRMTRAGAIVSMQPVHVADDWSWAGSRLGPERSRRAYAWKTHVKAGAALACGSDAPVSDLNPGVGIHTALTRMTPDGNPTGGWHPEQRLTWPETLRCYTSGAARAVGRGKDLGTLSPGKLFDVSVFDRDCRSDAACWLGAKATATVIGGTPTYRARR